MLINIRGLIEREKLSFCMLWTQIAEIHAMRARTHRETESFPPLCATSRSGTRVAFFRRLHKYWVFVQSIIPKLWLESSNIDAGTGETALWGCFFSLCYLPCIDAGGPPINETTLIAYWDNFLLTEKSHGNGFWIKNKKGWKIIRGPVKWCWCAMHQWGFL